MSFFSNSASSDSVFANISDLDFEERARALRASSLRCLKFIRRSSATSFVLSRFSLLLFNRFFLSNCSSLPNVLEHSTKVVQRKNKNFEDDVHSSVLIFRKNLGMRDKQVFWLVSFSNIYSRSYVFLER